MPMFTPMGGGPSHDDSAASLAALLREQREDILRDWEEAAREISAARHLPALALRDSLPALIERIAEMAEEIARGAQPTEPDQEATEHALSRLGEGFDLSQVVQEYSMLRTCVVQHWNRASGGFGGPLLLDQAIDLAIATSVARYAEARDRTLQALDRISAAALESHSLDTMLHRLLAVFVETTPTVETAAVFLRSGDRLVLQATVGLGLEEQEPFSLRVGEGFAGTIAAEKVARFTKNALEDPLVRSQALRRKGIRALYGVPLMEAGEVIGVAHMGSRSGAEFSPLERRLFNATAERAAGGIRLHRLRDEARKRAAELARLENLISVHPDFFFLIDRNHRFTYVSPSLLALWGKREQEEVMGQTFADVGYPPHLVEAHRQQIDRVLAGETVRDENAYTNPAGQTGYYEFILAPIRGENGRVEAVGGVSRDISQRRQQEVDLERAAEFRDRFIGIIGHDLRTPLMAIKISAKALLSRGSGAELSRRAADRIVRSSERMERMIRDMADLARVRLGSGLSLQPVSIDMAEVCRMTLDELEAAHPGRSLSCEATGDCRGCWDPDRLAQMLSNLVANALQHGTPESAVTVRLQAEDDSLALEVHNLGPVIPAQAMAQIFEPFHQAPEGHAPNQRVHLGLGLYIVQEIVHAHGGDIQVTSSEQQGTTFRVRLPRGAPEHHPIAEAAAPP